MDDGLLWKQDPLDEIDQVGADIVASFASFLRKSKEQAGRMFGARYLQRARNFVGG